MKFDLYEMKDYLIKIETNLTEEEVLSKGPVVRKIYYMNDETISGYVIKGNLYALEATAPKKEKRNWFD